MDKIIENIYDAGDSLVAALEENSWKTLYLEGSFTRIFVPSAKHYCVLTLDATAELNSASGFIPDGFLAERGKTTGIVKEIYAVDKDGKASLVARVAPDQHLSLVEDMGPFYDSAETREYANSLVARRTHKNGHLFEVSARSGHLYLVANEMVRHAKKSVLAYWRHHTMLNLSQSFLHLLLTHGNDIDIRVLDFQDPPSTFAKLEGIEGNVEHRVRRETDAPSFILVDDEMYIMETDPVQRYIATFNATQVEGTTKTAETMREFFERAWEEAAPAKKS